MRRVNPVIIGMVALTVTHSVAHAQTTWHVDDDNCANPGTGTLLDPFCDLQDALAAACDGDEIWVAEGIYRPTTPAGERTATFQLKNGVGIYGGFPNGFGDGTFDARDADTFVSTLSGDLNNDDGPERVQDFVACIGGDDLPPEPGCEPFDYDGDNDVDRDDLDPFQEANHYTENSYHITTGTGTDMTAALDGFTITGGNADGSSLESRGGGMYNDGASPTLTDCLFVGNSAAGGGGMYNIDSSPTLINSVFSGNSGGGIYNTESSPTLTNCTFSNNWSGTGGGMFNIYSSPTLTNCTFSRNSAMWGGGMANGGGSPALANCIFTANSATWGGGMLNGDTTPILSNCLFSGNSATTGGGMYNSESSPTLTNCTLSGNTASTYGGGIWNEGGSLPTLVNCILWGNSDPRGMGESAQIASYGMIPVVTHTCIQGLDAYAGNNNIGSDPLFVDADGYDNVVGTDDDDLHLQAGSPCIDVGDSNALPPEVTMDIDGDARVLGCRVDMGIDESPDLGPDCNGNGSSDGCDIADTTSVDCNGNGTPDQCDIEDGLSVDLDANGVPDECETDVLFVNANAPPGGDGLSWETAFSNLKRAWKVAQLLGTDMEIWVARGTYAPAGPDQPRSSTFRLINGVSVYGGFAGVETELDQRDPGFNVTILTGDLNGDDGPESTNIDDNAYHVVVAVGVNETAVLDGFTITGGNSDVYPNANGAGMYNYSASPTVANCTFSGNAASHNGGGMYIVSNCNPTLTNCTFSGNAASRSGGGIYNTFHCSTTVADCTFRGNSAEYSGGGMYNGSSSPALENCTFSGNSAEYSGGGMYNDRGSPTLANCTFSGNSADYFGGGMYSYDRSSLTLTNCTFGGNSARNGRALACASGHRMPWSEVQISNSILWNGGNGIWKDDNSTISITYSNVQSGWPGVGNIDADPMFADADGEDGIPGTEDDNLRLLPGSPCVNTGDPAFVPEPGATDLDGNPRLEGCRVDMGAYETDVLQDWGDFDADGEVDLIEFAFFQLCFDGAPGHPEWWDTCLCVFDFDENETVDLEDYAGFQVLASIPPDMALIPGGESQMGDTLGQGGTGQLPVHTVYLDSYYIDADEVTNQRYADALNWAFGQGLVYVSGGIVCDPRYNLTTWDCDFGANGYRPPRGASRILSGGHSGSYLDLCRSAHRGRFSPYDRAIIGFRCAVGTP